MRKKLKFVRFLGAQRSASPVWLTIYADLMTVLMLFFLMLWGLNRMSLETYTDAATSLQKTITKEERTAIKQKKVGQLIPENFEPIIKSKSDMQGIRLVFGSPILFGLGSAQLKPGAEKPLDEIAEYLSNVDYTVIVEGHTDNIPIKKGIRYSSNWELSLDRARSVVKYFQKKGISPERLVLAGYGEYHSLYPNDTVEHRRANRRIEISIVYWEK